jgi:hypothetical protein
MDRAAGKARRFLTAVGMAGNGVGATYLALNRSAWQTAYASAKTIA